MKNIFLIPLFFLLVACATPSKNESVSEFDSDFKKVFQASMSVLKDKKFTIKNFDWNSGEIDAYLRYQDKEIRSTVALEQRGKIVKVRMINSKAENSANISASELNATENSFFESLNKELGVKQKK
jgi:hypothetical protein